MQFANDEDFSSPGIQEEEYELLVKEMQKRIRGILTNIGEHC
jgi:hypothetical protein